MGGAWGQQKCINENVPLYFSFIQKRTETVKVDNDTHVHVVSYMYFHPWVDIVLQSVRVQCILCTLYVYARDSLDCARLPGNCLWVWPRL